MPITGNTQLDKKIWYWFIVTLVLQLIAFTTFLVKLDSRVATLEEFATSGERFTQRDWELLNQKLEFYIGTIQEIKSDIKEIKNELKK